jgi:hypothetical protein
MRESGTKKIVFHIMNLHIKRATMTMTKRMISNHIYENLQITR